MSELVLMRSITAYSFLFRLIKIYYKDKIISNYERFIRDLFMLGFSFGYYSLDTTQQKSIAFTQHLFTKY